VQASRAWDDICQEYPPASLTGSVAEAIEQPTFEIHRGLQEWERWFLPWHRVFVWASRPLLGLTDHLSVEGAEVEPWEYSDSLASEEGGVPARVFTDLSDWTSVRVDELELVVGSGVTDPLGNAIEPVRVPFRMLDPGPAQREHELGVLPSATMVLPGQSGAPGEVTLDLQSSDVCAATGCVTITSPAAGGSMQNCGSSHGQVALVVDTEGASRINVRVQETGSGVLIISVCDPERGVQQAEWLRTDPDGWEVYSVPVGGHARVGVEISAGFACTGTGGEAYTLFIDRVYAE
jgi:hypothetical protein